MFNGDRVQFEMIKKKGLEMDGGDGFTTGIYLMLLNCALKSGQNSKFCYVYFTIIKKRFKK